MMNFHNIIRYDEGSDTIWLSNVKCSSNDIFLANCSHSGFGNAVCQHSQDVAISCGQRKYNMASCIDTMHSADFLRDDNSSNHNIKLIQCSIKP